MSAFEEIDEILTEYDIDDETKSKILEKIYRNIPKKFVDKRFPMTIEEIKFLKRLLGNHILGDSINRTYSSDIWVRLNKIYSSLNLDDKYNLPLDLDLDDECGHYLRLK